jgi:hypothetical protein
MSKQPTTYTISPEIVKEVKDIAEKSETSASALAEKALMHLIWENKSIGKQIYSIEGQPSLKLVVWICGMCGEHHRDVVDVGTTIGICLSCNCGCKNTTVLPPDETVRTQRAIERNLQED